MSLFEVDSKEYKELELQKFLFRCKQNEMIKKYNNKYIVDNY